MRSRIPCRSPLVASFPPGHGSPLTCRRTTFTCSPAIWHETAPRSEWAVGVAVQRNDRAITWRAGPASVVEYRSDTQEKLSGTPAGQFVIQAICSISVYLGKYWGYWGKHICMIVCFLWYKAASIIRLFCAHSTYLDHGKIHRTIGPKGITV